MKTYKYLGIITVLYILVFVWLKAVNELSFKSVEHFVDLSLVLIAALVSGIVLIVYELIYLRFILKKKNVVPIYFDESLNSEFSLPVRLIVSVSAAVIMLVLVNIKTGDWGNLREIISISASIITFFLIYTSLSESGSKVD